jgi:hypothetical protein
MKTFIILIVLVAATVQSISAQMGNESNTRYGFAFSQFTSGSGFQPGYEAQFSVQPSAKAKVSFGIFVDNETKKFSGITITHRRLLMANRSKLPLCQPIIFYNFIYRKTTMPELSATTEIAGSGNMATYTSLEHHLGFGLNINISKNISIESGLGYGLYLGSIKRPSNPDPITREISGTNGGSLIFKTGIGFRL